MATKTSALAVVLFATILFATIVAISPSASASGGMAPGSTTMSVVNKVPDFYAEGKGEAYTNIFMKISSKGGYLNTGGTTITLTPWGYVTADWTIGRVYIIFLANVTETNFYIAYLYLTNSSTPMIVRLFEYRYATLKSFVLTGVQYVFSRYTTTPPIEVPTIKFIPKAQPGNVISAIGPELYINQDSGQVINETSTWKTYPLLEQYFQGANEYNEIWSLFTDDAGSYYFGIFYLPNNDPNHVILEHQVRLNDYKTFSGRTFDATWTKKGFPHLLTVRLPQPSIVKVNGFPVKTDSQGVATIYVPKGPVTIEAPNELDPVDGTRWHFSSWSSFGNSNPLTMKVGSPLELNANYNEQFLLTVDSEYGNVQGAGWYDHGANATFSAIEVISAENGTRRVFVRWDGDYASTSTIGFLPMNSPKHVTAIWKTQFNVKLELIGVPSNATAQVSVNGQNQVVNGSNPTDIWIDSNTQITIEVQSTQISGSGANYNFGELRVDNRPSGSNILITKPLTVDLVYSASSKSPSSIDLNANPQPALAGQQLTLTGKISAKDVSSTINLFYSSDNAKWDPLADVPTSNDGTFSYTWKPDRPGAYFIRAYWSGNEQYAPSSRVVSVSVREGFGGNPGSDNIPQIIGAIVEKVNSVPFVPAILGLAGSLLTLGSAIALLIPGSSPVLGYFIGSLLIGFVFVFPISAIALSLKAARSHRSPGVVWLIPLATIWVAALAMLIANGLFFFAPAPLLDAMVLLLIASNALFMPMAFSVGLARVVAS